MFNSHLIKIVFTDWLLKTAIIYLNLHSFFKRIINLITSFHYAIVGHLFQQDHVCIPQAHPIKLPYMNCQTNRSYICDRPRENRPSSHLGMIVEIPVLKVVNSITSFCSC